MPKVPGTFREKPGVFMVSPNQDAAQMLLQVGALYAMQYRLGECSVLVAREPYGSDYRWHLSIAHMLRYPTWDEKKAARYLAPELKDVALMAELFPKIEDESEWVNLHPNAFHLHEVIER